MTQHPSITQWQRHEEGAYEAQHNHCTLSVRWKTDPSIGGFHGFFWAGKDSKGVEYTATESEEEPEIAMAKAEAWAATQKAQT